MVGLNVATGLLTGVTGVPVASCVLTLDDARSVTNAEISWLSDRLRWGRLPIRYAARGPSSSTARALRRQTSRPRRPHPRRMMEWGGEGGRGRAPLSGSCDSRYSSSGLA